MRPVGALSKTLGLALAAAALVSTASVQAAPVQNKAVVRAVRGTANYSSDAGANWKKLNVGASLKQNSVIRTAPGSTVDLFLGDNGPVVRVTESTTMGIDKLTRDATGVDTVIETQLDLRNGRILGNVKKLAEASKYEVKTPFGVAGIRGTRYDISADGRVTVIEGTVIVVYVVEGEAVTVTVNEGETSYPPTAKGQRPRIENVPPTMRTDLNNMFNDMNRVIQTPTEKPTVVIVVEPKEGFQEGDPFKVSPTPEGPGTQVNGTSGGGE